MNVDSPLHRHAFFNLRVLVFLTLIVLAPLPAFSQQEAQPSSGLAWQVQGSWKVDGKDATLRTGDYVPTGSLLRPGLNSIHNSVTVLLPDGQLILYECFTVQDCSRGFRMPLLYRTADQSAVDMLARIHQGLVAYPIDPASGSATLQRPRLPRDEQVVSLGPDNHVRVAGLASRMSNGHYTYDLRPLDRAQLRQFHLSIEKDDPSVTLELPSSGLYFVTIRDSLNMPRIDLLVAAFGPTQAVSIGKLYHDAASLMKEWNTYYLGWPVHDFQRAYLESFIVNVNAPTKNPGAESTRDFPSHQEMSVGSDHAAETETAVAAEPSFFPKPGRFDSAKAITIQCTTSGAEMHYTVDGSEPTATSPVYSAPIMVKTSVLTIKSFASFPGKKDSPVITGIFRIKE